MSRKRLFIENIFAYGFISILRKIVPFLMLPIITRLLPDTSDYGVFTIYNLVVGFATPLAIMGISDAMFREFYEKEDIDYRNNVVATAQKIIMTSSIIVTIILIITNKFISNIVFNNANYSGIIIWASLGVLLLSNLNPLQAPTRLMNKRKMFVFTGVISSILTVILNVVFLWLGYSYYALVYSSLIVNAVLIIVFTIANREYFTKGSFNKKIAKELFKVGLPLLPGVLIYWVYNSMDRIMIVNMLGTAELGIFSIGANLAQVSLLIYAGFSGGWHFFAFSTMKDEDQVDLNSKIFEYLTAIAIGSTIIVYPFVEYVFKIAFTGDYVYGYIVAPYLYLAPLLLMVFQVAANQFLVIKKSWFIVLCLSGGLIVNIVGNFYFIKMIGIEGAAIATLCGYMVTILIVMLITRKLALMKYSYRTILILILMPMYFFVQRYVLFEHNMLQIMIMLCCFIAIMILYKNDVKLLLQKKGGK